MFTKKTNNIFLLIIISLFTAQAKAQDVKSALSKEIETAHAKGTDFKDFSLFSIMPWMMYSTMTERDLAAIYEYLRTVKPLDNETVKWKPRTPSAEVAKH